MQEVVKAQVDANTVETIPYTPGAGAADGEAVGSNFERKYIVEGRKINTIAVKKL